MSDLREAANQLIDDLRYRQSDLCDQLNAQGVKIYSGELSRILSGKRDGAVCQATLEKVVRILLAEKVKQNNLLNEVRMALHQD